MTEPHMVSAAALAKIREVKVATEVKDVHFLGGPFHGKVVEVLADVETPEVLNAFSAWEFRSFEPRPDGTNVTILPFGLDNNHYAVEYRLAAETLVSDRGIVVYVWERGHG